MNNNLNLLRFVYLLLDEDYERNHVRIIRKNLRDVMNPFELPDKHFKQMFRLKKISVQNLVQDLQEHNIGYSRIPFHIKVLATLNFFASGSFQSSVGNNNWTSLSQPTMSKIIFYICELITTHLLPLWVKFPANNIEKNEIKQGFYNKWGGRGVLGVVDGTHVEILAPPMTDEFHPPFVYINRKGKFSINVMLISDSDTRIIGCCARFPGSVHDAAIWQVSAVKRYLRSEYENGDKTSHIIGDSGYPLEPWLFTPIQNAAPNTPESRFNSELTSSRNVIERTNGILKGRFRCLSRQRLLMYHPSRAANIIYSCCVLHNIAVASNLPIQEDDIEYRDNNEEDQVVHQNIINDVFIEARVRRNDYIQQNFN